MFLLVKGFFKRQYHIHKIYISFDCLYPILFPSPYLGRYIVVGRDMLLLSPLGYAHIKPWVIYKDEHIGLKVSYIFFAVVYILKYGTQISKHLPKTHKSEFSIVFYQCTAYLSHSVTSPKTKISCWVFVK